jgi:hypothetical protein
MASLDNNTLWGKFTSALTGLFKTNTTKAIGSDDLRELVTDIKDSYYNVNDHAYVGKSQHRGVWDASVNTFPDPDETTGSANDDTFRAGDYWFFSVAGTVDGELWPIGTMAIAKIDAPGQTAANWRLL